MTDISLRVLILLLAALLVASFVFWRMARGTLKSFGLEITKLFKFWGETHKPVEQHESTPDLEAQDDAQRILRQLQIKLRRAEGSFIINDTTVDNARVASHFYNLVRGTVIGTCFHEDPVKYGERDLARHLPAGTKFIRLTTADVCPEASANLVRQRFGNFECVAELVVLPEHAEISRIGGIFSRLPDRSHLALVALNLPETDGNRGIVFTGEIAERLHGYYWDCSQREDWPEGGNAP